MNQFRQAWQVHALSSVTKSFAESYPLLNSSIVMILAGMLWGPVVFMTFFPALLPPLALFRFPWPILGGIAATLGGLCLWFSIRDWLNIRFRDWLLACLFGNCVGLGLGSWLFRDLYPPQPSEQYLPWGGWQPYTLLLMVMVGVCTGVAFWITVRHKIQRSGWIVAAQTVVGLIAGIAAAASLEDLMVNFGTSSDGYGERLVATSLFAVPLAFTLMGILSGVIFSVLRIQQAVFQSAGKANSI